MKYKTQGLVLSYIKYGEQSIIVRIYTVAFGLQSYLVRSVRKVANKHMQIGYFYPLVPLDMIVSHRPDRELQQIHEVSVLKVYQGLPFVPEKQPYVSLFCGLLQQITAPQDEPQSQDECFDFVLQSCLVFDEWKGSCAYFSVQFLAKLSHYVGIGVRKESLCDFAKSRYDKSTSRKLSTQIIVACEQSYCPKDQSIVPWATDALHLLLIYYEEQWPTVGKARLYLNKAHNLLRVLKI